MGCLGYGLISFGGLFTEPALLDQLHGLEKELSGFACTASRLGLDTAFYGKFDYKALCEVLASHGVNIDNLLLPSEEFSLIPIEHSSYFYFTSFMAVEEGTREAGFSLVEYARSHGNIIVFSPSLHPAFWENPEQMKIQSQRALSLCESGIVEMDSNELVYLMDEPDIEKAAARLMVQYHPRILLILIEGKGCMIRSVYGDILIPGFPAESSKETIRGDIFTGAFLSRLASNGKSLEKCSIGDIASCAIFAHAVSALTLEKAALPSLEEAEAFLRKCLI